MSYFETVLSLAGMALLIFIAGGIVGLLWFGWKVLIG